MLGVLLLCQGLGQLLASDQALAEQDFAEPITTGRCRCHDLAALRAMGWTGVISAARALNLSQQLVNSEPILQPFDRRRAQARHLSQLPHRGKGAVLIAIAQDRCRFGGTDPGQGV